jgi:uncharacterized linocin/CFP29 family protein
MNHLLRSHAPIGDAGWELLDSEVKDRLLPALGARRLVDFAGPRGWEHSATNLGRTRPLPSSPGDGVSAQQRRVLPVVELRADFEVSRSELRDADRGAADADLAALDVAARQIAVAENVAVCHGWADVFTGMTEASPHEPLPLGAPETYPAQVATGVEKLLAAGVAGPYALALGAEPYRDAIGMTERGGFPLREHLGAIIEGPIVYTPGIDGAVLASLRGGDFLFDCGQDIAIGYEAHDEQVVRLYVQESFTFRVATPEAAVALRR